MDNATVVKVIGRIRKKVREWRAPIVTQVSWARDPYQVLISCLISLRTKDAVTSNATERLFSLAKTPKAMLRLTPRAIEKAIYPACYYRNKAKTILHVSSVILNDYAGRVPDKIDELLKLKGVGRKTANLVVSLGYNKHALCVDTHVHRISNRLGYVKTKNPYETEFALRKKLPRKHWIEYNELLVNYGQQICTPISPKCSSECVIQEFCQKVGVTKHR